ncbi:glutathione-disulfide reductase [Jannaschia aquimarina]|uniref:Glutathione reductase n=1 Tax=Jannaschia aquimarina TaxID=935700 RepID=A0A0D1EJ90_9RHOB|nr:glutathione-disulfide reductase [Jannaschia aquimarina]KIT17689.1 Glutathione amide reductase [Jannaschia aquimarina]SNS78988.1 NADPH-glutathione reductase [Jannaschia aquimarina]
MAFDYDLFVIGGGSGGVRAARLTALDGHKVALAEESRMGGTCVIRGCVPKKLMVFASEYAESAELAKTYGWDIELGDFKWPAFRDRMHSELDRLENAYATNAEKAGVTIYKQRAKLTDPHTVELADGTTKTAKHILVAAGGHPVRPPMENADLGIVSDDVFHLERLPKKLLIVGGGYIGCEFAGVFNGLGCDVSMFIRKAQILRGFDDETRGHVADCMQRRGVTIHTGCAPTALEKRDGGIWVKGSNGHEEVFDEVLWATGRKPNTSGLGLEEVGVKLDRRGAICVDEYLQTDVPSIYALGDVIGRVELTPVAIREAIAFHKTVFGGEPTEMDYDLIPTATFTQPELGTVGLTEEEAEERGPTDVYCTAFRPMQMAFAGGEERVLFKMLVERETEKVLGVHIVGPQAAEMIQFIGVAVKMGATKADFDRTCALHPTIAEEMVTMKEPVRQTD